jgi:Pentapeptide repeats (8 copies)
MSARSIAKCILVAGIATLGFYWYPKAWPGDVFLNDFYDALSASLLAISITVLLIDGANEERDKRQLKKRLIWEMGSMDQAFAIRAVREIQDAGWLTDGSLRSANLTLANLQQAQLGNACLEGVVLASSNLKSAFLEEADLQNANLKDATAESLIARRAKIQGAVLQRTKLRDAVLEEINGGDRTDMMGASLIRANLRGAKLSGARLEGCDFIKADLTGSDLSGANLLRADMTEAILDRANLERADISELQGWESVTSIAGARILGVRNAPEGFRQWAVAHGALDTISDRESPTGPSTPQPHNAADSAVLAGSSSSNPDESDSSKATGHPGPDLPIVAAPQQAPDRSSAEGLSLPSSDPMSSADEIVLQFQRERVYAALNWQVGNRIIHESFGSGILVSKTGPVDNPDATIDFGDKYGRKSLSVRLAPMWKVPSGE